MNLTLAKTFARPVQNMPEYLAFLEFCETYFRNRGIEHPIVVEIGIQSNLQKRFYEELLGAEHIGIDCSNQYSVPDILGNSHHDTTLAALKEKLNGRSVNLLFIDNGEIRYESIAQDYAMYGPLVSDLIAFHNTAIMNPAWGACRLWRELQVRESRRFMFIEFYRHIPEGEQFHATQMGIGVMVRQA